jgi:hypothetical protein
VLAGSPSFPPVVLPTGLNVYTAYILAGFREAHPEIDLDSVLSDEGRRIADMAETACYSALADALDGVGMSRAFTAPINSVPGLEPALRAYMATPTDGYDKPVFVGHGLLDIDVPSPIGLILNSQMWINQFVGSNEQVDVHWYPEDHSGAMVASMADSHPVPALTVHLNRRQFTGAVRGLRAQLRLRISATAMPRVRSAQRASPPGNPSAAPRGVGSARTPMVHAGGMPSSFPRAGRAECRYRGDRQHREWKTLRLLPRLQPAQRTSPTACVRPIVRTTR